MAGRRAAERPWGAARRQAGAFPLGLPDVAREALAAAVTPGSVVLEYGSGGSSFLALERGAAFLMAVESDAAWAAEIDASLAERFDRDRFVLRHADIGPTGPWGRSRNHDRFRDYHAYPCAIWDDPAFRHPDLVVIDGRFRPACFATTAARITRPVTVLLDDYADREGYHWLACIAPVHAMHDRMAEFRLTPGPLPPALWTQIAGSFARQL